jgi:hypothetical protein
MIQICTFKEKEKEGGEENPNLVANGRFQCLWPLEGERKASFSPLITSPPQQIHGVTHDHILRISSRINE